MNYRRSVERLPGSRLPRALDDHAVRERNGKRNTILRAEISRHVPLSRRVFNQVDVSRSGEYVDTTGYFNLRASGESYHELPRRPSVPVRRVRVGGSSVAGVRTGRRLPKDRKSTRLNSSH